MPTAPYYSGRKTLPVPSFENERSDEDPHKRKARELREYYARGRKHTEDKKKLRKKVKKNKAIIKKRLAEGKIVPVKRKAGEKGKVRASGIFRERRDYDNDGKPNTGNIKRK